LFKLQVNKLPTPFATLWLFDLSHIEDTNVLLARLGAEDLKRYNAFSRPLRKQQFLLGRILLKTALSTEMGILADDIHIVSQQALPPRLILPNTVRTTPRFCLAHSGNYVACALSQKDFIGLDVERMNSRRNLKEISQQAFTTDEQALLQTACETEYAGAFYRIWTRKEALYKLNVFEQGKLPSNAFYRTCSQQDSDFLFFSFSQENLMITLCRKK